MCRIYQNAHNVIIWLGASTREIDCLFHWMCHPDQQKRIARYRPISTAVWSRQFLYLRGQLWDDLDHHNYREGLQDLLRREWFSRVWVIQEAALARAATITCGRNTVSSWTFVVMPILFNINCNENVQSRLDIMPGLLRKSSWWSTSDSGDLGMLLQKFGNSNAQDPRDIIYALLGLSKDAFESNFLRPNYQISLQEAIQHTVAYLLSPPGNAIHYPDYTGMPRWDLDQFLSALKQDLPSQVYKWNSCLEISTTPIPLILCQWMNPEILEDWVINIPHPQSEIGQKIWDRTALFRKRRDAIYRASQIKTEME